MLKKSVALAAAVVLASGGASYAAKPALTPVDPTTLPQGAPPTIAYHAYGTGIITPNGTIATPITTTPPVASYGPVDGRYVVARYRQSDAATGAYGTQYYLVDEAGNAQRVGGTYSQLDHGASSVGSGFAGMTMDGSPAVETPMALLNLRTGRDFRYDNSAYLAVSLFTPTANGVPFAPYTKKSQGRTVKMWRADGSFKKLFTLPKGRQAEYVDLAHTFVFSSGTKQRWFASTPSKPGKARWTVKRAHVLAVSPSGKRVLLRRQVGNAYELRNVSNGKLLRRWTFPSPQYGAATFENNDDVLIATPGTGGSGGGAPLDLLIRCRLSGACEKVAEPGQYFGFNN